MNGSSAHMRGEQALHATGPVAACVASPGRRAVRRLRVASLAAVALAVPPLAPAAASAGEYEIDFCKAWSSDAPAAQLPYTAYGYAGGVSNDCNSGGSGGGLHAMLAGGIMAYHSNAGIALQVPAERAGITIKRVWTRYSSPGTGGSIAFARLMAGGALLDNNVTPQSRADDRVLPVGTRQLEWSIYCSYSAGATPCYFPAPADIHHVYKARLFLSEFVDPTVAATGGSVLEGGPHAGPRTLALDATDSDSGVAGLTVTLGQTVVADVAYPCSYDDWSACRRDRRGQVIDIDTTKVTDGTHALSVVTRDAAGNKARKLLGEITVANGRSTLSATGRPRALIRLARSRVTVSNGRSAVIRGRLVDDGDRPIAGATIQIDKRSYVPKTGLIGPGWARMGALTTDGNGAFVARIPRGPSRALRFSFDTAGAGTEGAAAEARVSVRAGVRVRASRRTVRNGSAIRFTGRVAGAVPRAGVIVTLQAYVRGRGWVPADSRPKVSRARADGRFGVSYRFRNTTRRTRYLFRILVNEDSAFAYTSAASRAIPVTVYPRPR